MTSLVRQTSVVLATTALALSVLLSGCTAASTSSDPTSLPSADSTSETAPANGAGVQQIDLDDVVAKQTVTLTGTQNEVDIAIFPLEVQDRVQILRVAITPHFTGIPNDKAISAFSAWGEQTFSPRLVDRQNLKVYSPIQDDRGQPWISSVLDTTATNGQTMIMWGVYAAPQDDVGAFDVQIRDGWPDFTDVPVQK